MNKKLKIALLLIFALAGFVQAQQRPENVAIGDIFCSNGDILMPDEYTAAGRTDGIGVVFYVDGTGQHGWITYKGQSAALKWTTASFHSTGVHVYTSVREEGNDANSVIKDLDGAGNTDEIKNETGQYEYSTANYPACGYAVDLGEGWYLPAAGQLNFMYAYIPVLNDSLEKIGGTLFGADWYLWSSDESSHDYAWFLKYDGSCNKSRKDQTGRVRAVRDF